jgi:hypothetical protein
MTLGSEKPQISSHSARSQMLLAVRALTVGTQLFVVYLPAGCSRQKGRRRARAGTLEAWHAIAWGANPSDGFPQETCPPRGGHISQRFPTRQHPCRPSRAWISGLLASQGLALPGYSIPPFLGLEPAIANAWNPTSFAGCVPPPKQLQFAVHVLFCAFLCLLAPFTKLTKLQNKCNSLCISCCCPFLIVF